MSTERRKFVVIQYCIHYLITSAPQLTTYSWALYRSITLHSSLELFLSIAACVEILSSHPPTSAASILLKQWTCKSAGNLTAAQRKEMPMLSTNKCKLKIPSVCKGLLVTRY